MTKGPEWQKVEWPLLEHLELLGWKTLVWSERQPDDRVDRSSDRNVVLDQRLYSSLSRLNPGPDGEPWLDEARINTAFVELVSMPAGAKLLEANKLVTKLLLGGVTVSGVEGWDGGRDRTIDYVNWEDWSANDFLAVSQFPVATPGKAPNIRPDVTLFVNGIPLVVIEAKPPGSESGIALTRSINSAATPTSVVHCSSRRCGAVVLDQSVHGCHNRRARRGGDVHGFARALHGLEGPVPLHT